MNIDKELNEKLKTLVIKSPYSYSTMLKFGNEYRYLYNYVMTATEKFPDDMPLSARIYYVISETDSLVKCKVCGKDIPHNRKCNAITGYASKCCSPSCAQLDPEYKNAVIARNMEKYGKPRPQMTDENRAKAKARIASMLRENKDAANAKRKAYNRKTYGYDSVSQIPSVKEKISDKWKNKTDAEIETRTRKSKNTKAEKYGNENFCNSEKAKSTITAILESDPDYYVKIAEKREKRITEKYGVSCIQNIPGVAEKTKKAKYRKSFNEYVSKSKYVTPMFDADYYAQHRHDDLKWKCNECGREFTAKAGDQIYYPARCLKCHPLHDPSSKPENELAFFIKTIYDKKIIENSRSVIEPNELDVYLPDAKIAFEMDGLYWHSEEMGTGIKYHLRKTERCAEKGIKLIHILESEWKCKRSLSESRIKNLLGKYDRTVFARKCEIRNVPPSDAKIFQTENHMQGFAVSSVNIGLYFDGELISLMTFGKCRFDKKHEWEMIRFCSKLGYHIPGAAGKLLKHFETEYSPASIVTYADRRWSDGNLYMKLGFKLDHISKPDYWYWNRTKGMYQPESRIKYQKHKLPKLLEKFDPEKSEHENMKANGYFRIYDCGNFVFEKTYSNGIFVKTS